MFAPDRVSVPVPAFVSPRFPDSAPEYALLELSLPAVRVAVVPEELVAEPDPDRPPTPTLNPFRSRVIPLEFNDRPLADAPNAPVEPDVLVPAFTVSVPLKPLPKVVVPV